MFFFICIFLLQIPAVEGVKTRNTRRSAEKGAKRGRKQQDDDYETPSPPRRKTHPLARKPKDAEDAEDDKMMDTDGNQETPRQAKLQKKGKKRCKFLIF